MSDPALILHCCCCDFFCRGRYKLPTSLLSFSYISRRGSGYDSRQPSRAPFVTSSSTIQSLSPSTALLFAWAVLPAVQCTKAHLSYLPGGWVDQASPSNSHLWRNCFLLWFFFQFRQEYLDTLYRYAKFQYECGNYSGAAEYLYFFRVLVSLCVCTLETFVGPKGFMILLEFIKDMINYFKRERELTEPLTLSAQHMAVISTDNSFQFNSARIMHIA